jgi:hypothetical protein
MRAMITTIDSECAIWPSTFTTGEKVHKIRKVMRPPTTNKNSPEANTALVRIAQKNVFNCIIVLPMNLSPLVEALNEFDEFAFTDTPLTTDLESGQFFAPDQAFYRSLRHLQQLSDLAGSEQLQRIKISFHRR